MNAKHRLKIALVSDAVLPFHKGGKETRIDYLAKELVSLGQDVHVYTMKWWQGDSNIYQHGAITYHAICRLYPLYVGKKKQRSFKEGILFGLACLKLVFHTYDILEVDHMPYFPLFSAKLVSIIKRKPLFATWHEAVGLKAWRAYIGFVPGTVAYVLERLCVRLPDHIIAVSERTRELLATTLHYRGLLSLVPNGIDTTEITAAPMHTAHSDIIYAGRLVKHKHVDMLIRAVASLKTSRPTIRCVIVGGGPEQKSLKALVKKLDLEKNVTITGPLPTLKQVYSRMKAAHVFVSPSTREGFGLTILEAYACRLSVVTVKHPDNAGQYLVQPGAGIVCDLAVEDISTAIATLLDIPADQLRTVDASQFDWSQSAAALKEVYGL